MGKEDSQYFGCLQHLQLHFWEEMTGGYWKFLGKGGFGSFGVVWSFGPFGCLRLIATLRQKDARGLEARKGRKQKHPKSEKNVKREEREEREELDLKQTKKKQNVKRWRIDLWIWSFSDFGRFRKQISESTKTNPR